MKILNQRDKLWKDIKINNTSSTIGGYGCTLTCLAMLTDTTPDVIVSKLKFSDDKIIWTSINNTDLSIRFPDMGRHYSYDNDLVKQTIKDNGGCLVEVDFDGVIKTPNDRHWILYIGDGRALDPWTGKNIPTDTYPIVKGFCIINKNTNVIIEDMTEEQKNILSFLNGKTEGDVREAFGALQDIPKLNKEIADLKSSQKDLTERMEQLEADATANNKLIEDYQSTITTAKSIESNLKADVQTWKNRYESKCKETVDKFSAWELIKLGFKKLLIKK
jgi:hypothetical protein